MATTMNTGPSATPTIIAPAAGRPNKAAQYLLSGATSGLASAVILQPRDLVKTWLQQGPLPSLAPVLGLENGQNEHVPTSIGGAAGTIGEVNAGGAVRRGKSVEGRKLLPTVQKIVKEEGVGTLWRGTVPTVVSVDVTAEE
ncbi:hypothetical protein QFC21_006918 [Naganishia friedmannii]|uniref:Uncharacterized protein n=1 Tax=Naganishia friedmannii TaxID=89922 RepID=A0ACC2V0N9_9TREE|nr:hypothetical protein QFC21_006918 [Naganishia friedmannii]